MNAVIIYLEDGEDGKIRLSVEAIGEPDQSLELANDVVKEILDCPGIQFLRTSVFTRPAERVQ